MKSGNNGGGGTAPKHGEMLTPLDRGKGFSETMSAMQSKTRSPHSATSMNNQWKDQVNSEQGGNCHGYHPK